MGRDINEAAKPDKIKGPAMVFGASGLQGYYAIEGLLRKKSQYTPVYAASRDQSKVKDAIDVGAEFVKVDLQDPSSIENALRITKAKYIFLVTTTEIFNTNKPIKAQQDELHCIKNFFDVLCRVYEEDGLDRHVLFSSFENVEKLNSELSMEDTNYIQPLKDGSICAHFSGKGQGGEYAIDKLKNYDGLSVTVLTLPFLHSNLFGLACPLPDEKQSEWMISACFGDSCIDMLSEFDLSYIVPAIFENSSCYKNQTIRISGEKITMNEVATIFSDIFGKDVIYNPLTFDEMSKLNTPAATTMAQMCHFFSNTYPSATHDIELTKKLMYPKKPQSFKDWLLTNSDHPAFEKNGLSLDSGKKIQTVTVFGATGMQGYSVIKGLIEDERTYFTIRGVVPDLNSERAQKLLQSDLVDRITVIQVNPEDDVKSYVSAVEGSDGVFLVTDFYNGVAGIDPQKEELHVRNVIDACAISNTVRHVVFSTFESAEEMNQRLHSDSFDVEDEKDRSYVIPSELDAKARAVAYARSKHISCTYVLLPYFAEKIFDLIKPERIIDEATGKPKLIMTVPLDDHTKVMCMNVDDLGPAVSNIFDSYQVYAGREIALVTEFITVNEAADILSNAIAEEKETLEKKEVPMDTFLQVHCSYAKDLGQTFRYLSKLDPVKRRNTIAKNLDLVPNATPFKDWINSNKENVLFRQMLGIR